MVPYTIVYIHGFVYHIHGFVYHSTMVLYISDTIDRYHNSLVIRGFVYHCIPGTWVCIPSFVTRGSVCHRAFYEKGFIFAVYVNPEPCKRACEGH